MHTNFGWNFCELLSEHRLLHGHELWDIDIEIRAGLYTLDVEITNLPTLRIIPTSYFHRLNSTHVCYIPLYCCDMSTYTHMHIHFHLTAGAAIGV